MPAGLLIGLYIGIGLAPLVLASLQGLPSRNVWRELSSGLVMVGFAMLLLQFLLSGRFRSMSGRIGIDITMRFHQLAAWVVLTFILVHPLLYAVPRFTPDPIAAATALQRMFSSPGLRTGVIAWWLLVLLIALAALRDRLPVRYEIWRLSHGLGAAAIAALSAHHTLRVGTYSSDPWLAGFWVVLTALALGSLLQVYVIKPLRKHATPYRLVDNRKVADRTWQLALEAETDQRLQFAPGQFVWLNLGHTPFSLTEHPFSISSAPADPARLEFTIKENGDFTGRIGSVPLGTRAYLDGPHGSFTLPATLPRHAVFIAGGVGFAPILSMLRHLSTKHWPHKLTLIYGNRIEEQILYRDEMKRLQQRLNLTVHLVLSEPPLHWKGPVGELTPRVLRECLRHFDHDAVYFVCGPTAMMDSVERTLSTAGIPGRQIISERFKYD